jgi:dephospho-CoA kinase
VTDSRPILRVGLTGGIASGKTTVAGILAGFGAFVIDADELAHRLLEPDGSAYNPVTECFGREILDDEQRIVRSRLAARVFHDDEARQALNAIVHPRVMEEAERRVAAYAPAGGAPITVFDAALLVETGLYRQFHKLIVVHCSRETQIRRLLARDGLETDEAEARIDSQAPLADKLAVADYEVETEGTFREMRASAGTIYASLLNDFEREFGGPTD